MILKKTAFTIGLIFLLGSATWAQKIKYKDLFVLLNAKQYDQAEPFLKKYLKENQDNPNAFLFMGFIFEERSLANDVLRETEKQKSNTDSAVLFFDRAFKEIDERELKKNEEYYQAYSRRDLRTGKFGLKLSDVQFDLEKRIKVLKDRQQRVAALKDKFLQVQFFYENSGKLFKSLSNRFKNLKEFYLRADAPLVGDLGKLSRKYDSCLVAFNDYKVLLQGLGKTGHNQELDPQEIIDFKKDGYNQQDYFQDELKFWDFKRWSLSQVDVIEKEVMPITENLVKLDAELNGLREKIRKDSVSISGELTGLVAKIKGTGLEKFDTNPMPNDIFDLKIKELEYGSELAQTRKLRDSSSLVVKQSLYKRQITLLARIDSVADLLEQRDFNYEAENYKNFIKNAYGSADVLKSMVKSTGDFAVGEKAEKERRVKKIEQILNWVYDQSDSIPATTHVTSTKYFPISIVPDSHTFGLTFSDTIAFAYFYAITPSRKATIKSNLKLDSTVFMKVKLPLIKGVSVANDTKQIFYLILYSEERREDKTPSFIYKVTTEGLIWSHYYSLEGVPIEATIGKENGELSLKISTNSGSKMVVIQPDGKLL